MKVEELMVGNLVVYFNGETPVFVVVRKINGDDGIVCLRQSDGHVFNTTIEYLLPIPVTADILKHNFPNAIDSDDLIWWPLEDSGKFCVSFSKTDPENMSKYIHKYSGICRYVHQLQNILHNCGRNDKISLP